MARRRHPLTQARERGDLTVWAGMVAAAYAQRFHLPHGNLWEPAIARYLEREVRALGDSVCARAFVEGKFHYQTTGEER